MASGENEGNEDAANDRRDPTLEKPVVRTGGRTWTTGWGKSIMYVCLSFTAPFAFQNKRQYMTFVQNEEKRRKGVLDLIEVSHGMSLR